MARSNVSICNLALQKLGQSRISSLTDSAVNAVRCNECFEELRDGELRLNRWKFSLTRTTLAPSSSTPDFTYTYAFNLPSDCLRPLFPARLGLDWKVENFEGVNSILTNDGDTLEVRYIRKITDPTLFDPLFAYALSCRIAWHLCEIVTQSNSKQDLMRQDYIYWIREAKRTNAIEIGTAKQPVDEWIAARRTGQLQNSEWGEE